MALTHVATSTIVFGTTNATPTYPAGVTAGAGLWLLAAASDPGTVTFPAITGWTKAAEATLGGGTLGAGTGPRRLAVYRKDTVDGTETGSGPTVTPAGGSGVVGVTITCWTVAAGKVFDVAYATGEDTTAGTATTATASAVLGEATGDVMVGLVAAPSNVNMSGQTFTATGATYGTATELQETGSTNGNDMRLAAIQRPVTAGTASAATVYAATSTQTAGIIFIRLREADPPTGASGDGDTAQRTTTAATGGKGTSGPAAAVQRAASQSGTRKQATGTTTAAQRGGTSSAGTRTATGGGVAVSRTGTTATRGSTTPAGAGLTVQRTTTTASAVKKATGTARSGPGRAATSATGRKQPAAATTVNARTATSVSAGPAGRAGAARAAVHTVHTLSGGTAAGVIVPVLAGVDAGTRTSTLDTATRAGSIDTATATSGAVS